MNFTNDSKKIMETFIVAFKGFYNKQTPEQQNIKDKILTNIFYNINRSSIDIGLMTELNLIKTQIKEKINKQELTRIELLNSRFNPSHIKKYIYEQVTSRISFLTTINKKKLTLDFYLTEKELINDLSEIKEMSKRLFIVFKYLSDMSEKECCQSLTISLFRTPFKKVLPKSTHIIVGPNHVNTAVTFHCKKNNSIVVFRKEEMFKTCIHEMLHALGLDWYEMPNTKLKEKMKRLYKIKSNMDTPEAYVEFWGCILNSCFSSYFLSNKNLEEYLLFVEYFLEFEKIYSLYQINKILRFMTMSYTDLYKNNVSSIQLRKYMYKEDSNVFMYYILKTLFLYNHLEFFIFCKNNNKNLINFSKTEENMNNIYNFISRMHDKASFINDISKIGNIINKKKGKQFIKKTMRMTAVELK